MTTIVNVTELDEESISRQSPGREFNSDNVSVISAYKDGETYN